MFDDNDCGAASNQAVQHLQQAVQIPRGTRSGDIVELEGKGMPKLNGRGRGALLLRVDVSVPKKLTKKQKLLIEELAREFKQDVDTGSRFKF